LHLNPCGLLPLLLLLLPLQRCVWSLLAMILLSCSAGWTPLQQQTQAW
jgi:hypothetical protein